jgi:hypothetical protein
MSKASQYYRISYWKNNTACSEDGDWDTCKVTPNGAYSFGEHVYSKGEEYERDKLIAFLNKIFEAGRNDMRRDLQDMLGISRSGRR